MFFVSNKTIEECQDKVFKFKLREEAAAKINAKVMVKEEEARDISWAEKVAGSAVHPDTGKVIPFYMRMSGFVVFNVPLVFAVLFTKNQTPLMNAGFQWLNQTYNAGMNYGNRNASSQYTTSDLGKGYLAATVTSVGIALFSRTLFASTLHRLQGPSLTFANSSLNYLAGAIAGASNLAFMRYKELSDGIKV